MNKELLGTLLAIGTAFVSGFAIVVNKFFVYSIDPSVFTAVRALIIGIIFLVLSLVLNKTKAPKNTNKAYLLLIGIIGGGIAFLLFFNGLKLTTAGRAAFLHKSLPLFTLILAYVFLKENVKKYWTYALVMFAGIVLILAAKVNPGEFFSNPSLGDALVLAATFLWAVENTLARKVMVQGVSNYIVAFSRMFIGSIVISAFLVLMGKLPLLFALTSEQLFFIAVSTGILFMYVFFWYHSIRLINVSKAASLLLLAPVISTFLGFFIFQEPLPPVQVLGSALILFGAYKICPAKSEFLRE